MADKRQSCCNCCAPTVQRNSTVREVPTTWSLQDRLGAIKVRLGFNRMGYGVDPGLYAIGKPSPESPVLVSANYKLSFDILRRELAGIDAFILVLDTKNVNVWCAAGKGTFGTDEIVRLVKATKLSDWVTHRRLVVPQLGAPGVTAHKVKKGCGFNVFYGPVRARDLPAFLANGMKATPEQRRVEFPLRDRLALTPVELRQYLGAFFGLGLLLGAVPLLRHSPAVVAWRGVGLAGAAWLLGCLVGPALLPLLPGRAFWIKGAVLGAAGAGVLAAAGLARGGLQSAGLVLWMLGVVSFFLMNFTGCATYTSISGVKKELKQGIPVQAVSTIAGLVLWMI